MIPLQLKIISYNKERNVCNGELQNGNIVEIDPFVSCAIELSDEGYENGEGSRVVGKSYVLTSYSVYPHSIIPHENGMIEV